MSDPTFSDIDFKKWNSLCLVCPSVFGYWMISSGVSLNEKLICDFTFWHLVFWSSERRWCVIVSHIRIASLSVKLLNSTNALPKWAGGAG